MNLSSLPPGPIRDAVERQASKAAKTAGPIRAKDAYRSKWERSYAETVLTPRLRAGEIADWRYEAITLKIGVGAKYTPDFYVRELDGRIVLHEVKGFRREAAIVRIKTAALLWPSITFVLVTRGRQAGSWSYTAVGGD